MIPRLLKQRVRDMTSWFPVVSVTGPRQSGKSTLVKATFPEYSYVNLEDPQLRREALDDPVGFIRNRPPKLIVDEAQYAPELFSMIQTASDERGTMGQYVLSGSQNFLLLKRITQSLAGRVGLVKLLPLSYREIVAAGQEQRGTTVDEFMLSGGYPRLHASNVPLEVFFTSYINTYVERDVSDYLDIRNLGSFRRFLELCALSAGNLINYTKLANEADVSTKTVKAWMSILESSYITFPLQPYYSNGRKRLTRASKLYFYDTGLLCHLLGIHRLEDLLLHPMLGAVFENFIISETAKNHLNENVEPKLFFYRDDGGTEVDLLDFTDANNRMLVELKSGQTYHDRFARHLTTVGEYVGVPVERRYVVARVESSYTTRTATVCSARDWLLTAGIISLSLP